MKIMGILNLTPDSFFDGGRYNNVDKALQHAEAMLEAGAQGIDVGGESTRPGAPPVTLAEELHRVTPILQALCKRFPSEYFAIDTSRPEVMITALECGVAMLNDVRSLALPGALEVAAQCDAHICLMHSHYPEHHTDLNLNLQTRLQSFFDVQLKRCEEVGIARNRLLLDPGLGGGSFGKTPTDCLQVLSHLEWLKDFNLPLYIGVSRKGFLTTLGDCREESERLYAGLTVAIHCQQQEGVAWLRTHDVAATKVMLRSWDQLRNPA